MCLPIILAPNSPGASAYNTNVILFVSTQLLFYCISYCTILPFIIFIILFHVSNIKWFKFLPRCYTSNKLKCMQYYTCGYNMVNAM